MKINEAKWIVLILAFFSLISCASPGIPVPSKPTDALIVVPRLFIDTGLNISGNYLERSLIVSMENIETKKDHEMKINDIKGDYLFYRGIKPGKYIIKEMLLRSNMKGIYDDAKYKGVVTRYIEVAPGKMTIFPFKLVLYFTGGDYDNFYYVFYEMKKEDFSKVKAVLSKDPNFKSWKVVD